MITSLAAMNLAQYRDRYPYDGAALLRMPANQAAQQAERLAVSSVGAAALAADLVEQNMLDFERELVRDLGTLAGRDLSGVDVQHVFIDSPNAITLFDHNDQSYAIGIDPGFWQAICFLYWNAALGQKVNDPRWFLILATKTISWFWTGPSEPGKAVYAKWANQAGEDIHALVNVVQEGNPEIWALSIEFVNTAIAFTIAHEVGHIVLGHLEGSNAGRLRLTETGAESRASAMNGKDQELEADAWAAEALFRWAGSDFKKQTTVLSVPALSFCLSALKSELTAPATNAIARATADSHPPDMIRVRQVHALACSHASEVAGSRALDHFVKLGVWVADQLILLEREGMRWIPEWFQSKGLA
jgi:hypothetical protein